MSRKSPPLTLVQPDRDRVDPPKHLGEDGRKLWATVQAEYGVVDSGGLELLKQAAESADRIASCRRQIDEQGELLMIRGQPRVNPLCAVERDARAALMRGLRHMNLNVAPQLPGR